MIFKICSGYQPHHTHQIRYLHSEYSLNCDAFDLKETGGILFNDITIKIGEDSSLRYADGFCPHTSWIHTSLKVPAYSFHKVIVEGDDISGYRRFTHRDDLWPVSADIGKKILCVGDYNKIDKVICFYPGMLMSFVNELPVALWFIDVDLNIGASK